MNSDERIVEEVVRIDSEDLRLEGILSYPADREPVAAALLLAPHPHLGGNMNNNVLRRIATRAAIDGAATLRFNYRGVGASEIHLPPGVSLFNHWESMEQERRYDELTPDCVAGLEFLLRAAAQPSATVIGYSLGSILAGMIGQNPGIARIAAISPPVGRVPLTAYEDCAKPKLFIAGDQDVFAPAAALEAACAALPDPCTAIQIPHCDHFYRKQEDLVYEALSPFLLDAPASNT